MVLELVITLLCVLCLGTGGRLHAQDNLESLLDIVEVGKTYALYKANHGDEAFISEKETYYLKLVPPVYKTILDTIELVPALNGNLDTSNYFIQTEVLVLKEPGAEWRTATVSSQCQHRKGQPFLALCLLKTTPDYRIIHRKFFPFKNILDTTTTDFVIPAKTLVVKRKVLVSEGRIYHTKSRNESLKAGEKIVRIPAGDWLKWMEITCPFGEFNDPSMTMIQQALKDKAYEVELTGKFDEQTKRALHAFQQDNLLEEGSVTPETIQRLGIKRERLIQIDF